MSDASNDQPNDAPEGKSVTWPDLSAYGITLGVVTLDADKRQLVYADESGKYKHIARNMGFSRTKWDGLWVRSDTRVEASAFRVAFPKVVVRRRFEAEIEDEALEKIRHLVEASRQALLPGFDAIGPLDGASAPTARPAPLVKRLGNRGPAATQEVLDGEDIDLSPLVAEARVLGKNLAGEEVFETPDGGRFVRFSVETETAINDRVVREMNRIGADEVTSARFLRGDNEASLNLCAQAFVRQMADGQTARVDELQRFFRAVTGREFTQDDPDLPGVIGAIDEARVARLNVQADGSAAVPDASMFRTALRLHESAQYYTVVKSERMTPLPIGVMFRHIASAMPEGSSVRVDNAAHGEFGRFGGEGSSFRLAQGDEVQDVLLAAYTGKLLDQAVQAYGTAVSREDHANVLTSLERMPDNGLGVFVIEGDAAPGRIGPSSRRFLDALANMRSIEGIVDIDGSLMGVPGALPSRVIVVGNKRDVPGHGGLPTAVQYVTDYESLWTWGAQVTEAIRKPGSIPYLERGGVAQESTFENAFQAPYIPTSMISDPALMIPRNLASPTRRAMLDVLKQTPHIDAYLENRLEYPSTKDLSQAVAAEQADAVALALHRAESGLGFMVADQTGIGKGRIIASLARAARIKGEPVLFLTEKAELFTDLWRDIEDTSSEHLFKNIMVLNDGAEIVSTKTGEVVAKSAPRDEVERTMRSMKFPEGIDIVFATYSQFNRDPLKAIKNAGVIDIDKHSLSELSASAKSLMEWVARRRKAENKKEAKQVLVQAINVLTEPELIAKMPLAAVKSLWIGKAPAGTSLIMDESHNASGESSQTTLNLTHGVMTAKNVFYSSATFARGEKNMRIYRRLFPSSVDVEGLHETLKKGGEPLQEALASMLAEDGALIRREHDLSMLKFEPRIDNSRTARNEKYADQLAEILSVMTVLSRESRQLSDALSKETREALEEIEGENANVSTVGIVKRGNIGNSLYMIMRGFLTVMTCELAVEEAVNDLKEGRKPVFVVDHTMEADLERRVEEAKRLGLGTETADGFLMKTSGFRGMLHDRLNSLLKVSVDGSDLGLRKNPTFTGVITQIEKLIDAFPDLPMSPIDVIRQGVERAGYSTVELSGRKKRVRYMPDGHMLVSSIPTKERKAARDRFNNGDGDAIVLTRAGNAGISLHDSYRFLNRGQRSLIEVEVPEDVVARTQFFGRVNRNGQMSYPVIKTLSTGLPAQNRVLALQNNKLRKMSANITANRDNAAITRDVPDIINGVGNEVAYRFLELDPELAKKLDIELVEKAANLEDELGDSGPQLTGDKFVSELMNRLVLLPVVQQRAIVEAITSEFHAVIEELDAKGENPLRPKFYDVHAKKVGSEVLELASTSVNEAGNNKRGSAFDRSVNVSTIEYTQYNEPMPGRELIALMKEGRERSDRFISEKFDDVVAYQDWRAANPDGDFQDFVIESLLDRKDALLERFKGKHATIADAMAQDDNNMVKQLNHKIDSIVTSMATMKIGSRIKWHDGLRDVTEDHAIVLSVLPPEDGDLHHAGRYRVRFAVPGTAFTENLSLSALLASPGFEVMNTEFDPDVLKVFDSRKKAAYEVSRKVLDGNVFRAAEMSIQTGQGSQAYYSDETGMANRAIVMPLSFEPKHFNKLPLRIHDQAMVLDFFASVDTGGLHSTSGAMKQLSESSKVIKRGMSIKKNEKEFIVSVPGSQHWVNWLRNHPDLMKVTGPFGGTRTQLFATVPLQDAAGLISAIYKTGMTMYAHADDHCSKLTLHPGQSAQYMSDQQRWNQSKRQPVRAWFAEKFGVEALKVADTSKLKVADPFAHVDGSARKLKAA